MTSAARGRARSANFAEALAVEEEGYWPALEFRVCREMRRMDDCVKSGMWCDGFIPDVDGFEPGARRIRGRAWVCFGPNQEAWTFALRLPFSVSGRDEIRWSALLPAEDQTRWLTIDREGKHLLVDPAD